MSSMVLSLVSGTFTSSNNGFDEDLWRYREVDEVDEETVVENMDVWAEKKRIKGFLSTL